MNCPFLRETRVRYCQGAAQRKLIPSFAKVVAEERCSTDAFAECTLYCRQKDEAATTPPCPLLHESLVQYCAASSVTRFVPYSEAAVSQCGNGSFRYCDLYLELTRAGVESLAQEIAVEPDLHYASNHWWVDLPEEGSSHLGIDAFLARMLGDVSRVEFVTRGGWIRPVACLTAGDMEWQVVFPEKVQLNRCNAYLRGNPARVTAEPYSQGWLFEAEIPPVTAARLRRELRTGSDAQVWMEQEMRRANELIQRITSTTADGGVLAYGVLSQLSREDAVTLFHEFGSVSSTKGGSV